MKQEGYLLDNKQIEAGARFAAMAEIFDHVTFSHFKRIGVREGWSCWEVGAGGTSVVAELANLVGETGFVLATDIDTVWMDNRKFSLDSLQRNTEQGGLKFTIPNAITRDNVLIMQHDIALDAIPEYKFDFIHARLVLVHVLEREKAVLNMLEALKPGGWLLIEDADPGLQPSACINPMSADEKLANRLRNSFRSLMAKRGVDLEFGRRLPALLRQLGLENVEGDGYFPLGLRACNVLELATTKLISPHLIEEQLATEAEISRHVDNVSNNRLILTTAPLISTWGQKAAG